MLGLLDRFRKKKKKEEETNARAMSELEQLCGDDKETYEALLDTIFLDPRKIEVSMEDAAKKAKEFEKAKDFLRAKLWYKIAGGLAVYEGDVKKVTKYFSECEKLAPEIKYPILKNPEKAVTKAQEYYRKYLEAYFSEGS
jgi:hypothetical protein